MSSDHKTSATPPATATPQAESSAGGVVVPSGSARVVDRPPTCAELEHAIVDHFEYVEKAVVRDDLTRADDRLVIVLAVIRGRPVGFAPRVRIATFVQTQLTGWMPALPAMRVLCSTYDMETGDGEV